MFSAIQPGGDCHTAATQGEKQGKINLLFRIKKCIPLPTVGNHALIILDSLSHIS